MQLHFFFCNCVFICLILSPSQSLVGMCSNIVCASAHIHQCSHLTTWSWLESHINFKLFACLPYNINTLNNRVTCCLQTIPSFLVDKFTIPRSTTPVLPSQTRVCRNDTWSNYRMASSFASFFPYPTRIHKGCPYNGCSLASTYPLRASMHA